MRRAVIASWLGFALVSPALADPPPERLEWRATALGSIYMLWRGQRQGTGWTLVRDGETNTWKLHHNGEAIDEGALDAMRARGIADAGRP
jgi:hypothetical protein